MHAPPPQSQSCQHGLEQSGQECDEPGLFRIRQRFRFVLLPAVQDVQQRDQRWYGDEHQRGRFAEDSQPRKHTREQQPAQSCAMLPEIAEREHTQGAKRHCQSIHVQNAAKRQNEWIRCPQESRQKRDTGRQHTVQQAVAEQDTRGMDDGDRQPHQCQPQREGDRLHEIQRNQHAAQQDANAAQPHGRHARMGGDGGRRKVAAA